MRHFGVELGVIVLAGWWPPLFDVEKTYDEIVINRGAELSYSGNEGFASQSILSGLLIADGRETITANNFIMNLLGNEGFIIGQSQIIITDGREVVTADGSNIIGISRNSEGF
jgi:hypothetical protein